MKKHYLSCEECWQIYNEHIEFKVGLQKSFIEQPEPEIEKEIAEIQEHNQKQFGHNLEINLDGISLPLKRIYGDVVAHIKKAGRIVINLGEKKIF